MGRFPVKVISFALALIGAPIAAVAQTATQAAPRSRARRSTIT